MVFRVAFDTAPMSHVEATLQDLEGIWMHAWQHMPSRMRSYNAETLRKLTFATLLRARVYTASNCSLIQVVVELSS